LTEIYRTNKRKLARAIKTNKEICWKDFCVSLDMNLGRRAYRAVMSTTALRVGTDGLHVDKVRSIVDELFLTRPIERRQGTSKNRNGGEEGGDNYRITEEDLIDVCRKINPNKAVSVNGIPGTAVERR
jgi:hypothetical protein